MSAQRKPNPEEQQENWPHLPPVDQYVSRDEYFQILEESVERLDWIDGVIYPVHDPYRSTPQAMAGASDKHIDIHTDLFLALGNELRGKECHLVTSDQKIVCGDSFAFPDITVYCGEREKDDNGFLTNPVVIVEILSPGTSDYDKNEKWEKYRKVATLRDYLLVSQDKLLIEHRHRRNKTNNRWDLIYYNRIEDEIALDSIDVLLTLGQICARVRLDAQDDS